MPAGPGRGADADQRHDRSAETDRPHLRHAGAQRDRADSDRRSVADRAARWRRDRERPAGAHRRGVPGAAMRLRGTVVRAAGSLRAARWADAVRRHRPQAVSLVPAALRTVLHSDLTRDDLQSIRAVTSGTAPLSAEDADAFTEKFGIPVLTSYAATEFGGGVAGWTLRRPPEVLARQTRQRGQGQRSAHTCGSWTTTATPLAADQPGLLEVKPGQLGPGGGWMRTTDMARIDADGFLWILGRADQAIIRGGFKVMPDDVRSALGEPSGGAGRRGRRPTRSAARPDACGDGRTARGGRRGHPPRPSANTVGAL